MPSDARSGSDDYAAAAAIDCAGGVLVPLLRARVHTFGRHACVAEADVAGFVACGGDGTVRLLLLDDALAAALPDASACDLWLAAHPALVAEIRARLDAVRGRRTDDGHSRAPALTHAPAAATAEQRRFS